MKLIKANIVPALVSLLNLPSKQFHGAKSWGWDLGQNLSNG